MLLLAGAGVLAGFLLIGSLNTPEPEAVTPSTSSTTTTTIDPIEPPLDLENFSVSQISKGEPFEWEQTLALDDRYPVALFEAEGWVYLFATRSPPFDGPSKGGLDGWRTPNGALWQPLGQVIPDSQEIMQVTPTDQGLLAVGRDQGGSGLNVWLSDNGETWVGEELPVEDLDPFTSIYATAAGGSDSLLVVAGNPQVNIYDRLQERLGTASDSGLAHYGWGIDVVGDEVHVTFYGPLGFPLDVVSAQELDLSPEEIEAVIDEYQGSEWASLVWTKNRNAGWQQTVMPVPSSIDSVYVTPEGNVVVLGYHATGSNRWTTRDGLSWERVTGARPPYRVDHWGGRLVGPSDTGGAAILASSSEGSWEDIGPGQLFPPGFDWYVEGIGAGPGGIAAIIRGWGRDAPEPMGPAQPATLTSNGATLTIDFDRGTYSLTASDGTVHPWSMNGVAPDEIVSDLNTGTISFHDPEKGGFLASFSIDDIFAAQNEYWSQYSDRESMSPHLAFAFTGDGEDWTIQDGDTTWDDVWVSHLEVTETHAIVVGITTSPFYDPTALPSFAVWSAAIP